MKRILLVLIIVLFTTSFVNVFAAAWSFEGGTGLVYNIPMPLKVTQKKLPDINITARYSARAFDAYSDDTWTPIPITLGQSFRF